MANQTCTASSLEFFGKSRVINFYCVLLAVGSEGLENEELLVAEIDVDKLAELPLKLISRSRPEMYGETLLASTHLLSSFEQSQYQLQLF